MGGKEGLRPFGRPPVADDTFDEGAVVPSTIEARLDLALFLPPGRALLPRSVTASSDRGGQNRTATPQNHHLTSSSRSIILSGIQPRKPVHFFAPKKKFLEEPRPRIPGNGCS